MRLILLALIFLAATSKIEADPLDDPLALNIVMCGHVQATLLDDHVSDARTIATAIHTRCHDEIMALYKKKYFSDAEAEALILAAKERTIDVLTTYVLKARTGQSPIHQKNPQ